MNLLKWDVFPNEIKAYTTTKELGDMSFNNPDKELIVANRKRLATILDIKIDSMIAPQQTHSTNYIKVSSKDGGKGILSRDTAFQNCDALYTTTPNISLLTFHADCTPILIYCRDKQLVASIHAGWLGTATQIVTIMVENFIKNYNIDPKMLYAYIGPCISKENFEVKEDVINYVKNMNFDTSAYYEKKDETHFYVDNKGLNKQQLLNLGVIEGNITISPYCTYRDNHLFYSHRKGDLGRNLSVISFN